MNCVQKPQTQRIMPFRLGILAAAQLVALTSKGAIFDLAADFSISHGNPNGVWTYGAMETLGSVVVPFSEGVLSGDQNPLWTNPWSHLWKNTTSQTLYGIQPGEVSLHPGSSGQGAAVRWTAPVGDVGLTYNVSAVFGAGDIGVMSLAVLFNGSAIWTGTDAGTFTESRVLQAGDRYDFVVYGGYDFGNTALSASFTSVPEPSSAAMAAAVCLVGLGLWRRVAR